MLANPSADAGELARLSGELAARLGPAIAARSREKGVVHRLRDVVRAGNQDFEKVYSSMFDFIVDDKGLAAYRASMAAVECPGAAARPQRGGKARLDELNQKYYNPDRGTGNPAACDAADRYGGFYGPFIGV